MMKTIHTLWMALALTAMCSFFTACRDNREPQWNPEISEGEDLPTVGDGQFVVSYGASDGTSTRALSDVALPANERISSLHYYVYEKKTGELIKRRKIRGINEKTKWPINDRNNMSWELRQDLQDTLTSGYTYRILFIANIDPTLFKKADGSKHPAVVRNDDKYESAKILLPEVPFSDNNMYYLWEDTLNAKAGTTVKRKDVLLRRLVTRTDVERKEIASMEKHLYDAIVKSAYNELKTDINTKVDEHIKSLCDKIKKEITRGYKDKAAEFQTFLQRDGIKDSIKTELERVVVEAYKTAILSNEQAKSPTNKWPTKGTVTTNYQEGTRANALTFSRMPVKDSKLKQTEELEVLNGKFTIIGFSGDETTKTNGVEYLVFSGMEPTSSFKIQHKTLWLQKGMNIRYKAICNPVDTVTITDTEPQYSPIVNIDSLLSTNGQWKHFSTYDLNKGGGSFFDNLISKVFKPNLFGDWKYGTDFKAFQFTNIKLPDITEANAHNHVKIIPSWTCEMVQP